MHVPRHCARFEGNSDDIFIYGENIIYRKEKKSCIYLDPCPPVYACVGRISRALSNSNVTRDLRAFFKIDTFLYMMMVCYETVSNRMSTVVCTICGKTRVVLQVATIQSRQTFESQKTKLYIFYVAKRWRIVFAKNLPFVFRQKI